ncbi:maestro heat-like repeat-containing protein family member 7 isoform X1 [Columba livia]|uniref:maestro heat-like repeat-containing protein family member 7 isoform X1 n=1 Tax=Columba livia TaxID=8932 RepID=UPI0031BA173B
MTEGQSYDAEAGAALLDMLVESEVSTLKQVPRIVRCIHQWFMTNTDESVEHSLDNTLVELTDAHPHDVVVALLRCAPSCDRAAAAMWRMMVTTSMTTKKVFRELLCVLEDWPLHSTSTCDGDQQDVLALAATRALWEILQMPRFPRGLKVYFPRLLLALLFQVVYSTEQMPDEVDTFWRECQEEGGLPTSPSRFIVLTVKALLCRLGYRLVAFEVERKRGWDTLLHAETHHCAMGLLAREIRVVSRHLNASVASYLVELLSRNEPRCELPAMAFLVEILASPGPNVRAESFLQLVPRYLQSNCSMTRSLLLKGLNVICDTPWMVPKMRFLVQRLTDLLQDADMDMVRMTLSVLRKVVRDPSVPISTPIALQLAERLQPLFDNESWYVRQLSVSIFKKVIERVANDGKKLLKTLVHQSLLPLIFHVFDENKAVAATCRDTLLQATAFLKKEKLRQVVLRDQQTEAMGECLLVECRSRAAEYLGQSLTYVQSPQDSIREAAVAFLGEAQPPRVPPSRAAAQPQPRVLHGQQDSAQWLWSRHCPMWGARGSPPPSPSPALGHHAWGRARAQPCQGQGRLWPGCCGGAALLGRAGAVTGCVFPGVLGQHMRAQPEKFQLVYDAVQHATKDSSPYVQRQALHTLPLLRAAVANGSSRSRLQELQSQLRQAWRRRRPSLWGNGWLCCWGSAQD